MTKIAIFQARTGIDPDANARELVSAIEEAASGGAEMLFTPEMSGLLDRDTDRARRSVRSAEEDPVLAACRDSCARSGIWLHLGSIAVAAEGGKFANRGFVVDSAGEIRASYDKIHLFDVDLPTGESWRESNVYRGGSEPVVVEGTPVGKLGLTICYDLRFPALFARLAEAGAQLISVPAAFTVPTGKAHWEILLRARAIEAGVFVVAAAQHGRHEDGRETYGHSLIVDPWGEIVADMGDQVVGTRVVSAGRERAAVRQARVQVERSRDLGEPRQLISVPAAFTVPTGKAHWEILLRARAIEAGVFVVAAAQHGRHEDGRETYGHSLIVDPWGEIIADMGDQVGVAFAEIDLGRVAEVRQRIPAIDHRRPIGEPLLR